MSSTSSVPDVTVMLNAVFPPLLKTSVPLPVLVKLPLPLMGPE
jgi:hypothetical protein